MDFAVNFDFSKTLNSLNSMNKVVAGIQNTLKKTNVEYKGQVDSVKKIENVQKNINVGKSEEVEHQKKTIAGLSKQEQKLLRIKKLQQDYKYLVNETGGFFSRLVSKIPVVGEGLSKLFTHPVEKIFNMNEGMSKFNNAFANVNKGGKGFATMTNNLFKSFAGNMGTFTNNISQVGGILTKQMFPAIAHGLKMLPALFVKLAVAAAPVALTILAIAAAIYTMKKIWDYNIGGIQTSVFQVGGMLRDILGQNLLKFQQMLKKLEPLFKIVFTPLFHVIKMTVAILGGLMKVIWAIIDPIVEVVSELLEPFAELQGEGYGMIDMVKLIGNYFTVYSKMITIALKIILFPIKLIAVGIKTVIDIMKILWQQFTKIPIINKTFDTMADGFKKTYDFVKQLLKPFQWLLDAAKKVGDYLGITKDVEELTDSLKEMSGAMPGADQMLPEGMAPAVKGATTVSTSSQRITNVSPNITINTSREITAEGAKDFSNTLSGVIVQQSKS